MASLTLYPVSAINLELATRWQSLSPCPFPNRKDSTCTSINSVVEGSSIHALDQSLNFLTLVHGPELSKHEAQVIQTHFVKAHMAERLLSHGPVDVRSS
jgi:hypothetical protein